MSSTLQVVLTQPETELCRLLNDCCTQLGKTIGPTNPPLELRVAGGWVRDKVKTSSPITYHLFKTTIREVV